MTALLKAFLKTAARHTIGRLPPPGSRLSGQLAIQGGRPVRDARWRPYADARTGALLDWLSRVGPSFRRIFFSGVEGLPQPFARKFERLWADYCGCEHALLVPHGTDALRIALAAAFDHDGLEYGGEVIVPNLSFIASATAALDRRFGVALVDVDPKTLLLDPEQVEAAVIPGQTRAIMAVHQFGQPADMNALRAIASKHGLKLIEDAAQAHGAESEAGRVGSLGDAAGFSFQSSKNLSAGEGGIITTNDDRLFELASSICNVGRAAGGGGRWEHRNLGWNIRPTEYQAALLLERFAKFDAQQRRRAGNFAKLREYLEGIRSFEALGVDPRVRKHGMYMFVLRYRPQHCGGWSLEDVLQAINAEGGPIHRSYAATIAQQPAMQKIASHHPKYIRKLPTPISDAAVSEIAYIPHHIFLGAERDMRDIAAILHKVEIHCRQNPTSP